MQNATTLRYYGGAPPLDATTQFLMDTGCIQRPVSQDDTAGLGAMLGGVAGSALGTFLGPAGTALGGTLGGALGGAVESAVRPRPRPRRPQRAPQPPRRPAPLAFTALPPAPSAPPPAPSAPRAAPKTAPPPAPAGQLGLNERRMLQEALKTGNAALVQDAVLRVTDPQRYELDRVLGRLPSQRAGAASSKPSPALTPQPAQTSLPESAQTLQGLLAASQQQPESSVQGSPAVAIPVPALRAPLTMRLDPAELTDQEQLEGDYYDTGAAQDRRPRPRRHISLIPLKQYQLAAMIRAVPALEKLDIRQLKLMAGTAGARTRDTAGIDPATRTYHAEPGETAAGITKKLTGDEARVPDLLASNPGHQEGDAVWRIPPGWIAFDYADTGAPSLTTQRKYIVQNGDSPIGIATKLGAKQTHPKWWSELKRANPSKEATSDGGNWKTLWAGEEIGIPDDWPPHLLAVPTGNAPAPSGLPWPGIPNAPPAGGLPPFQIPTLPASNSTMDAGVMQSAQGMLALWRYQNAGACNPPDFGQLPTEYTGTATPRTVQAVQSFQIWWNQKHAATPLRIDGTLDDATYKALYSSTVAMVPSPAPLPQILPKPSDPQLPAPNPGNAMPTPILGLPAPSAEPTPASQVPGLPPGWTPVTPIGPYGMPWQAPTPPPLGSQVPGLPPGWTSVPATGPYGLPWQAPSPEAPKKSDSGLLPLGLGLLAAMLF